MKSKLPHVRSSLFIAWRMTVLLLISACSVVSTPGPTPTSTSTPTPLPSPTPDQKVTIRWLLDNASGWHPDYYSWDSEFNSSQDDIELTLMYEHGDLNVVDTLLYYNNRGDQVVLPDIAPFKTSIEYALRDVWLDLTPYLQEYDMSGFDPTTLRLWQDENGKQFGLPVEANVSVLYYNRDLFDAAGIPYPPARYGELYANGEEWNIAKLEEIAIQLTLDGSGKNPTQPGFNAQDIVQSGFAPGWIQIEDIAALFGPESFFDKSGQVRLPDSWRDSMHWYYSGMWEQRYILNHQQLEGFQTLHALASGQVAMVLSFSWYSQACCKEELERSINWDMAALPSYHGRVSASAVSSGFGILNTTPYPQEAVQTLYYLTTLPELVDSTSIFGIPAQISRRPAYFSKMDERFTQGINWQVAVDAFTQQELSVELIQKAPNMDFYRRLWEFQQLIEGTPGLDIDATLADLITDLQTILNDSRP
jgi:multiple sugar transport system substrate-binding protein